MHALRRLVLDQRHLAALIFIAALALKLLMPSGYMVSGAPGRIAITICSGVASQPAIIDLKGDPVDPSKPTEHGKAEMPCAFSSLLAQALGAPDPVLLGTAITFVMGVALLPKPFHARPAIPYLRPPSRGPPAFL